MTLRFAVNIPQTVTLRHLEGKAVESQFGGMQHMFLAQEGTFYVSDTVGVILTEQFSKLGVKPGEPVEITKSVTGHGPGAKTRWIVTQRHQMPVGEQSNGTFAVPATVRNPEPPSDLEAKLAASIHMVEERKRAQQAQTATQTPAWAEYLVAQSNALIDAYSRVLTHASQYPNVRGEDVRSIFLSTFINVSKNGGRSAA